MKSKLVAAVLFVVALGGCAIVLIGPPVYIGVNGGYYGHGGYGGHGGYYGRGGWR